MKNNTSFYGKQHVVLWKTSRRFMKNKPSFYEKTHVVLERKTSLHKMGYKLALFNPR